MEKRHMMSGSHPSLYKRFLFYTPCLFRDGYHGYYPWLIRKLSIARALPVFGFPTMPLITAGWVGHCGESQKDRQRHTQRGQSQRRTLLSPVPAAKVHTPPPCRALRLPRREFPPPSPAPATVPKQLLLGNGLLLTAPKAACTLTRGKHGWSKSGCLETGLRRQPSVSAKALSSFRMADLKNTPSRALSEHVGHAESRLDFRSLCFSPC